MRIHTATWSNGIPRDELRFDSRAVLRGTEKRPPSGDLTCPMCRRAVRTVCRPGHRERTIQASGILEELRSRLESAQIWRTFLTAVRQRVPDRLPEQVQWFLAPMMLRLCD
ncbi:hypothetical protein RUND412_001005 [Rhizina undulata]